LKSLFQNPFVEWDHPAYTQVQRGKIPEHSVRTHLWRYTEWGLGEKGSELHNEETDPQELHNLVSDPTYSEVVRQMKTLLHKAHPTPVVG
jgi:uncharacterized sulfatase